MKSKMRWIGLVSLVGFIACMILVPVSLTAETETEAVEAAESLPDSNATRMLKRAGSGFANILYGPLEILYQMKEEIKRSDPVRGFFPGLFKGLGWLLAREAVGVYEMITFFLPHEPLLKEFDTEWLYA